MIKISILSVLLSHLVHTIFIVRSTTGTIQERNTNNNDECGITSYYTDSTNSLIPNGEYALPGQWPWVVALSVDNEFECTGSILTNRHILTAALCLGSVEVRDNTARNMKVALGQFKLRGRRVVGTVNRKVASYKIISTADIPDINNFYYFFVDPSTDLAILVLRTPVKFSPFIRPICLWSGSTDIENVVDRTGYVVRWAFNESTNHVLVSEPRMLRLPIVSQETCLRSNQYQFANIVLNRTFCAGLPGESGSLGESGPCFGNHGSGLMLFDNSTGRYHLRGVLSHSAYSCNGKYSVYVDVAKYLPWIRQQISIT